MGKMRKWRRHTVEFKRQAVERMKTCENIGTLACELQVQRKLLYTWKYQLEGRPEARKANLLQTADERKEHKLLVEIDRLRRALGQKALEIDFFKDALLRINQARQADTTSGVAASTKPSGRGRKSRAT